MVQYQVVIMLNLHLIGLEGKSLSELKSELSLTYGDIDLSSYIGSSGISTIGIITNGT